MALSHDMLSLWTVKDNQNHYHHLYVIYISSQSIDVAYLANKFFKIRGTGRRFVVVIAFLSTGQVG